MSLEKLLRLSGTSAAPVAAEEDVGSELVLAAKSVLEEALAALSSDDPDDDGDDDDSVTGDTDHDYAGSALYKKLRKRGLSHTEALKFLKNEKSKEKGEGKKVAASMVEAALVALGGLAVPELSLSWSERTAAGGFIALGGNAPGNGKMPYGKVTYADPGYQADGKKRYPIDTEEHARAALAYIRKAKNRAQYSPADYKKVLGAITRACRKFGIDVSGSDGK